MRLTQGPTKPADILAQRVAVRHERAEDKTSARRSKKHRKRSRSSSTSSQQDFREARGSQGLGAIQLKAQRTPGLLLSESLHKMHDYMASSHPGISARADMPAVAETYLTTVLLPSAGSTMSQRNEREMRTLAMAIDLMVQGDTARAGDILVQRFKAVETASADGNWSVAKHLELLPAAAISAVPDREREAAARMEKESIKLKALSKSAGAH